MIDKDLLFTLKDVGFEDKEARVYLALLELGEASATEVANFAELKRPIVYYILENLKKNGYVQDISKGKVRRFSAIDPSRILHDKQIAVEELRFMLPLIQSLQNKSGERPRVEYLEGKDAILAVYRAFEKQKVMRFLTSMERLNTFIPEEVEAWISRFKKKKKYDFSRHLLADTKIDREWGERVAKIGPEVRTLPKGQQMEMDFSIANTFMGITSFDPLFIVVIHSEKIAQSAAKLFDLAYEMGTEIDQSTITSPSKNSAK